MNFWLLSDATRLLSNPEVDPEVPEMIRKVVEKIALNQRKESDERMVKEKGAMKRIKDTVRLMEYKLRNSDVLRMFPIPQ